VRRTFPTFTSASAALAKTVPVMVQLTDYAIARKLNTGFEVIEDTVVAALRVVEVIDLNTYAPVSAYVELTTSMLLRSTKGE
jgi:hypothetical protein